MFRTSYPTRWMLFAVASILTLAACSTETVGTGASVASRPVPVVGHPHPLSQLESTDPTLAANKKLAFDMWRGVVNSGHVELADQLLTENYIQHSPLLPTGREAFKKIFSVVPRRDPIPPLIEPPLVALVAERNLVVMAFVETLKEPGGSGTYTSTHFNLFRVQNGRLAEHWHSLQGPPGPDVLRPEAGGPQRVIGVSGAGQVALLQAATPQLTRNKGLVFDAWRQAVDDHLAKNYVEHNPNPVTGRAGFRTSISAPIVAVVAEGDLVVLVTMLEHPHPHRVGETYTSTWFDMFRIENGRLAEHWDPSTKLP